MQSPHKEVIDTVAKACAYGDFEKLQQFILQDPASVNHPDEQGYYPLQWAALNNRIQEVKFLLSNNASVNACDHTGQTALHWSAVRGSLPVVEVLLQNKANYETRDNRGYTVCHVAAQYGQTAVLYHLALKWSVDIDMVDNDGRTPLHWAAYKGFSDTIRLLLVFDASHTATDKEGCTPLHWSAIKGNGDACTVLLQGGSVNLLTQKDITGSTPAQLAIEKGHRYLGLHLAEYKQKQEGGPWFGKKGRLRWMFSTQLCPLIWALILGLLLLFVHKVVGLHAGAALSPAIKTWSWVVLLFSGVGLVFLYRTTTADPGYIPTGWDLARQKQRSESPGCSTNSLSSRLGSPMKELDSPALWAGNWNQLCVTCRVVRPLRAKHCSVTDRCIEVYDHYCPWVGNAIGKGNRHYFLVFLWLELFAMVVSAVVGIVQIRAALSSDQLSPGLLWMFAFEGVDIFVCISVAALSVAQASQVARNITTNELANWHRYKYLQGHHGSFSNPFSRGIWKNCTEAFQPHRTPTAPVYMVRADTTTSGSSSGGCCGGAHHDHDGHYHVPL